MHSDCMCFPPVQDACSTHPNQGQIQEAAGVRWSLFGRDGFRICISDSHIYKPLRHCTRISHTWFARSQPLLCPFINLSGWGPIQLGLAALGLLMHFGNVEFLNPLLDSNTRKKCCERLRMRKRAHTYQARIMKTSGGRTDTRRDAAYA